MIFDDDINWYDEMESFDLIVSVDRNFSLLPIDVNIINKQLEEKYANDPTIFFVFFNEPPENSHYIGDLMLLLDKYYKPEEDYK